MVSRPPPTRLPIALMSSKVPMIIQAVEVRDKRRCHTSPTTMSASPPRPNPRPGAARSGLTDPTCSREPERRLNVARSLILPALEFIVEFTQPLISPPATAQDDGDYFGADTFAVRNDPEAITVPAGVLPVRFRHVHAVLAMFPNHSPQNARPD